jgi:hypothetical protein
MQLCSFAKVTSMSQQSLAERLWAALKATD